MILIPTQCNKSQDAGEQANAIAELPAAAFEHTPDLISLDLGHCRLEAVDGAALRRLEKLEYLRIDGNRIQTLSPLEAFPTVLRYVLGYSSGQTITYVDMKL